MRRAPRRYASGVGDFDGARLHVVTGKGGTGKTTVAAALAIALASRGKRVLLTEVEGRQGLAQLFDVPPLPYEERPLAVAPGHGDVYGLAVDAEEALLDYLEMFYNLRRAGRTLKRLGAIDFATTIAPGLRDVLLTGKIKEAVARRKLDGTPHYDAVVLDAPPTGRIGRFLNVNSAVAGLARVGPIHGQAEGVMTLLRSERTRVHLVTVLEEMPVQETVDGVAELSALGLPVGGVVVNLVREPLLAAEDLERARTGSLDPLDIALGLKSAGIEAADPVAAQLVSEAADHAVRISLEEQQRDVLSRLQLPSYELPQQPEAIDLGCLYVLAELLQEQGMA